MIAITLDIDWATDEVLEYCLDLLSSAKIKTTFFATHTSQSVSTIESKGHEVGIHPNFLPNFNGEGRAYTYVIDEMVEMFPNARGVRFHSLATSAPVLDYCFKKGILYDSSVYLPFQTSPYIEYTGIKRIPFVKSDLQTVIDENGFEHTVNHYDSTLPYVYMFHPIHIFLNTCSAGHYGNAKIYYKDTKNLIKCRNKVNPGVEDFFLGVLKSHKIHEFVLMKTIHDRFK